MASLVFVDEITLVFSARQPNGWKVNISEFVIVEDYETFFKLYEHVYAHPPPNGEIPKCFFTRLVNLAKRALSELGSILPPYYLATVEEGNKAHTMWKTKIEFDYNNTIPTS
jgi:hypothetical protein